MTVKTTPTIKNVIPINVNVSNVLSMGTVMTTILVRIIFVRITHVFFRQNKEFNAEHRGWRVNRAYAKTVNVLFSRAPVRVLAQVRFFRTHPVLVLVAAVAAAAAVAVAAADPLVLAAAFPPIGRSAVVQALSAQAVVDVLNGVILKRRMNTKYSGIPILMIPG